MYNEKCLLVPFKYSHKVAYVVEFSHKLIRLYAQRKLACYDDDELPSFNRVLTHDVGDVTIKKTASETALTEAAAATTASSSSSTSGRTILISTPYTYDDLWDEDEQVWNIQTIQNGDILYIFHKKYPIMVLKRYANANWAFEELELRNGPFLAVNTTDITVSSSTYEGYVMLTASSDLFKETDVGRQMRFKMMEDNIKPWSASEDVEKYNVRYSDKKYYQAIEAGKTGAHKPVHSQGVRTDGGVRWKYMNDGVGVVKIVEYFSATSVKAYVTSPLPYGITDGTPYWEMGMLHGAAEYPISGAFFRNRFAFLVNTENGPNVCLSMNGDYNNFADQELGEATAETAITVPVLNKEFNEGKWLFAGDVLFVGTGASEFYIDSVSTASALASDNVQISQISTVGSKAIMPVAVGAHIFFVDRYGLSLRDLTFNYYNDGYDQTDVSLLGKHLFLSRIVAMCYQEVPDKVLWCLMGDGTLTALTFSAEQEVAALSRHDFSGKVESIAVIPNLEACRDELWLSVKRFNRGIMRRTVEWMDDGMPQSFPSGVNQTSDISERDRLRAEYMQRMASYLDGAVLFERGADDDRTELDNLLHLNGMEVSLFADGVVLPPQVVSWGRVSIKKTYTRVLVGLKIKSQFVPQNMYVGDETSSGIGQKQRINHLLLMLYCSGGGKVGQNEQTLCDIFYRPTDAEMNKPQPLFSGNKEILFNGFTNTDEQAATILIENDSPLPMNILAIVPSLDVS